MINKKADTAMEYQPSFPASPPAGASPLSLILQGVSLLEAENKQLQASEKARG